MFAGFPRYLTSSPIGLGGCRQRGLASLLAGLLVVTVAGSAIASEPCPFEVVLEVDHSALVDRTGEVVRSGIPLPRYGQNSRAELSGLALFDEWGNEVPVQLEVLSRWTLPDSTTPVKWMLVSFPATLQVGDQAIYTLRAETPQISGDITWTSSPSTLTVDTGAARIEFPQVGGSLISSLSVAGTTLVDRAFLAVRDSGRVDVAVQLQSTQLEVAGPVLAVVRQRVGLPALGLTATVRYHLATGSSEITVDVRLENAGSYGAPFAAVPSATVHFDSLEWVLQLTEPSTRVADDEQIYNPDSRLVVEQDYGLASVATELLDGFEYLIGVDGVEVETGGRFAGGLSTGPVTVLVDRFWQNFPKSFEITENELRVGLFPAFGNGPEFRGQYKVAPDVTGSGGTGQVSDPLDTTAYRFEGGRWSSHRLQIGLRPAQPPDPILVGQRLEAFEQPLMALPQDRLWAFEHFAFGEVQIPRLESGFERFERMQDVLVDDLRAEEVPMLGALGLPGYRDRGGRWGGRQMYGWQNFGDLAGDYGFTSGHFDLAYSVLINFFRTGNRDFFDIGRDLIRHRRDYDQYHSQAPADVNRGGQFLDSGYWHGNSGPPDEVATWVHGLLLWHVMTGDPSARSAAVEVGDFIARQNPQQWSGYWGAARLGWQIETLLHLYNYLGDPSYRDLAELAVDQWEVLEMSQAGCGTAEGCGFVVNAGYDPGVVDTKCYSSSDHAIVAIALAKLWFVGQKPEVLAALNRLGDQLYTNAVDDGDAQQQIGPWIHGQVCFATEEPSTEPSLLLSPSTHDGWAVATALAYYGQILEMEESPQAGQVLGKAAALYLHLVENFLVAPGSVVSGSSKIGWHSPHTSIVRRQAQMSLWGLQLVGLMNINALPFDIGNAIEIQIDPTAPQ